MQNIKYSIARKQGIASLVSILILSGIFLLAGLAIINFGLIDNITSASEADSKKAFFIAEAGAEDALIKIARDKNYQTASDANCVSAQSPCASAWCKIDILGSSACVSVIGSSPSKTVVSIGHWGNKQRKIQIDVSIDAGNNGKIISKTWQELTN